MKKFFASLFACLFGLFLSLGIVELVIRLLPAKPVSTWSDRPEFYFSAPGSPTMQGMPYALNKPENVYRIAVVGDSFTFAPYMQFSDTFAAKLETMLNLNQSSRHVEVINYGVPAYSTSHEVPVVEKALQEGADLVILEVTLNDPEIKEHTPTGIREDMNDPFGPLKLTPFWQKVARHWRTFAWVLERLHNTKTHNAYRDYFINLFENPRNWDRYKNATTKISTLAKNAGKPLVAVVFPLFGLPFDDRYPFYGIHQKVGDLFAELAVPSLDVSPIYRGIPLERMQVIPGADRHPNEIAHRMAAEHIYLWLENKNLIPEEFRIKEKFLTRLGISGQRKVGN